MRALLDVNVLIALLDSAHVHHRPAQQVAARLAEATRHPSHEFWPDSVSLAGSPSIDWSVVITGRQITDAYLLCLAVANSGRFVTFDRGISHTAAMGARAEHLLLL